MIHQVNHATTIHNLVQIWSSSSSKRSSAQRKDFAAAWSGRLFSLSTFFIPLLKTAPLRSWKTTRSGGRHGRTNGLARSECTQTNTTQKKSSFGRDCLRGRFVGHSLVLTWRFLFSASCEGCGDSTPKGRRFAELGGALLSCCCTERVEVAYPSSCPVSCRRKNTISSGQFFVTNRGVVAGLPVHDKNNLSLGRGKAHAARPAAGNPAATRLSSVSHAHDPDPVRGCA